MGGGKVFSAGPQGDWSRECTRNRLISAVNLQNWAVFYTRRDARKANDFITTMQRETGNMGINCKPPIRQELSNDKIETLLQELRRNINPQVLLFLRRLFIDFRIVIDMFTVRRRVLIEQFSFCLCVYLPVYYM